MSRFSDNSFVGRLIAHINSDQRFELQTRWFDGSVLLDDGDAKCWMKIYRGKVIESLPFMPPLGYTFKLGAPSWAWDAIASGHKKFGELLLGGRREFSSYEELYKTLPPDPPIFALEGNLMEAFRIIEAIYLLAENYVAVSRQSEEQS